MSTNRKPYGPLDNAVMDVLDELRNGVSGRDVTRLSGLAHNRTATILRRATPPPTMGEVEALAQAFGKSASWVVDEAERRLGANVSSLDARREAIADQIQADEPDDVAALNDSDPDEQ